MTATPAASQSPRATPRLCPNCREPAGHNDQFCEACGTELRVHRGTTLDHVGVNPTVECRDCGRSAGTDDEYCPECGLLRDDGTDRIVIELSALAGVSDRGHVHARNEDAMALGEREATEALGAALAAVVCDGVSSVEHPELASRTATDACLTGLLAERKPAGSAEEHVAAAVEAAAEAISTLPYSAGRGAPSCTLVAALVETTQESSPEITVAWVGDSRVYWLTPAGSAEPAAVLTTDHSWAVEIVALGELDEEAAAADPRAHAITRWMGADSSDVPSITTLRPTGPGVLLLCSDGLWNYLPDAAALASAVFSAGATPLEMATELTAYALDCGGRDNITVVAVPIGTATSTTGPNPEGDSP